METVVARLLQDFEAGKMTRRQLIQSLVIAATAASAMAGPPVAAGGFKATEVDHISYQVSDYKKTRDFYADLMGMSVANENERFSQCELNFGNSILIARNRAPQSGPGSGPRVDHIAYRIENWDTDKIKAELERRGLKPRLDTGGPGGPPNYASFHVDDPDGFDLQISGVVRPGDSLYKKP
jgi:catechol 2,3-dioxygenase-like lactoylglutathione lyase family enzyme